MGHGSGYLCACLARLLINKTSENQTTHGASSLPVASVASASSSASGLVIGLEVVESLLNQSLENVRKHQQVTSDLDHEPHRIVMFSQGISGIWVVDA